jgi:hypothetical protein
MVMMAVVVAGSGTSSAHDDGSGGAGPYECAPAIVMGETGRSRKAISLGTERQACSTAAERRRWAAELWEQRERG